MKNVSRLLPLLPGIALLTGCNQKVQKDNGQNSQKPNIIYIPKIRKQSQWQSQLQ